MNEHAFTTSDEGHKLFVVLTLEGTEMVSYIAAFDVTNYTEVWVSEVWVGEGFDKREHTTRLLKGLKEYADNATTGDYTIKAGIDETDLEAQLGFQDAEFFCTRTDELDGKPVLVFQKTFLHEYVPF